MCAVAGLLRGGHIGIVRVGVFVLKIVLVQIPGGGRQKFLFSGASREGSTGKGSNEKSAAGVRECVANHPEEWNVKRMRDEMSSVATLE